MGIYGIIILDNNYKNMELNKQAFWGILLIYCIASVILFESLNLPEYFEAWASNITLLISIYFIILSILLILNNHISKIHKDIKIKISWVFLIIILLAHANSLLTYGNCENLYKSTEKVFLISGIELCSRVIQFNNIPYEYFFQLNTLAYFLLFILFIIQAYYSGFKKVSE
jgi:hypothetical protein